GTQDQPGGTPSIPQLRNMIWQGFASGANGVVFYSLFDLLRNPDVDFEVYWPQVVELVEEVAYYAPLLLSTEVAPAVSTAGQPTDTDWLSIRAAQYEGKTWLLAVNRSETVT